MGIDDAEPPRHHGGAGGGGGVHHFPVGSRVEVLSNEEDLGGVYFSATVVRPPVSRRRSATENSERLYVEYLTLLASDDRPDRLREYADISSLRPPPPPSLEVAKRFELNDVVDAFYKDGWWMGVVTGVLGGGERFVVTFEKPPDELEFRPSSLRAHWDWVDGVWAGLENLGGEVFDVGAKVEVSFERDDDYRGAWFPAAIFRDLENAAYLVEFKDKNGSWVKAEVDSANVRPCPPIFKDRKFGISERVEAFFDSGWWSGFITKKEVKKNEYNVFLEHMQLNRVFKLSELRAYVDWKEGKWFIASNSETASTSTKRRSGSRSGVLKKHKGQSENVNQETEQIAVEKMVLRDEDPMMRVEDVAVQEMVEVLEDIETTSPIDGSSRVPQSLVSSVLIHEGGSIAPNEHANQETEQIAIEKMVPQDEEPTMRVEDVAVQEMVEVLEDIETTSPIDGSSPVPQSLGSSVLIDEGSIAPNELPDSGWPFVKRNAAWKAIESMEVLRRIPQKPHFQPLHRFKETAREGLAIGCMVTFSNVVERSCSLKINDPKCMVEDVNHTLLDLETHGFDFGMVRDRVMKLLAAKDKEEKLVHEVKDIEGQILDHVDKKREIERKINVINGHITRLQQQLELAQIAKDNEVQQIAHLQAGLDQTQQGISSVRKNVKRGSKQGGVIDILLNSIRYQIQGKLTPPLDFNYYFWMKY